LSSGKRIIDKYTAEYFSLLSFAIPGVLGTETEFRKNFENPILRGRDALASDAEKQKMEEKLQQLFGIANKFIIRRTADLLTKFRKLNCSSSCYLD
jgi:DNA repair and recombination RAD54-like protein